MIIYNEPCSPPDESDMDELIVGMHPSQWPTVDELLAVTEEDLIMNRVVEAEIDVEEA